MAIRNGWKVALCCMFGVALIQGCGSDDPAPERGASGKLTQGPVVGAVVYADNVSGGVRFTKDSDEVFTTTDGDGNFTLPSVPGYNYVLVSEGGTDKTTNQTAIRMIAPAGAANVTPLTTLVALDTTGQVKAKIEALGTKFDADISVNATPAVLNLSKSIETIVASLAETVTQSAATPTSVSSVQLAAVQVQALQSIATTISAGTGDLAAPASLNSTMVTAVSAAITNINTANTNIAIPPAHATTIATNAVTASTTAVLGASAVGSSTAASITEQVLESAVINTSTAATISAAVQSIATTVKADTVVVETPTLYVPPVIPVVTVITVPPTGSTGGTGGSQNF